MIGPIELKQFIKEEIDPMVKYENELLSKLSDHIEAVSNDIGKWAEEFSDHASRNFINTADINLAIKVINRFASELLSEKKTKYNFISKKDLNDYMRERNFREIKSDALDILIHFLHSLAINIFKSAKTLTRHANRKLINKNDLLLAIKYVGA